MTQLRPYRKSVIEKKMNGAHHRLGRVLATDGLPKSVAKHLRDARGSIRMALREWGAIREAGK